MQTVKIGTAEAKPGTVAFGTIKVAELADCTPVEIQVGIVNGLEQGPRLWVHGGLHGDEYAGAYLSANIFRTIEPKNIKGALIVLPVLNILAFRAEARSSPIDGMDMNRIWPGAPLEGVMHVKGHSESVVYKVFQEIKKNADFVIDVHGGSVGGMIAPYVAYYLAKGELGRKNKALAFASGMKIVWQSSYEFSAAKFPGSVRMQCTKEGIPALTLEDEFPLEYMFRALLNVMKHLEMMPGKPEIPDEQFFVVKGNWLRATRGGIYFPKARPAQKVEKDQVVSIITDFFGNVVAEYKAPCDGVVIGTARMGPVTLGQYVGNVGLTVPKPKEI